jgi:hypothetical protein
LNGDTKRRVAIAVLGATALVLVGLCAYYALPTARYFIVDARTGSLEVTLDGAPMSTWEARGATACIWRDASVPRTRAAPAPCGNPRFEIVDPFDLEVTWPPGAQLTFEEADGTIVVSVVAAPEPVEVGRGVTLGVGSLIVIPGSALVASGPLLFSGTDLVLGQVPMAGRSGLLRAGHFRAREVLFGRAAPATMLEGDLLPGDAVAFDADAADSPAIASYGIIDHAASNGGEPGALRVVAFSAPGLAHLVVDRLGATALSERDPAKWIRPTWTDRIRTDPVGLALVAMLGLAGALIGGAASIVGLFEAKGADAPAPDASLPVPAAGAPVAESAPPHDPARGASPPPAEAPRATALPRID